MDELALVRAGIDATLRYRGIEVAAETRSGREALSLAVLEHPDLVVVGAPADLGVADVVRPGAGQAAAPARHSSSSCRPATSTRSRTCWPWAPRAIVLRSVDPDELGTVVDTRLGRESNTSFPALHGARTRAVKLPPLAEQDRRSPQLAVNVKCSCCWPRVAPTARSRAQLSVTLATVKSHLVRIYAKLARLPNCNEALGRGVALGLLR